MPIYEYQCPSCDRTFERLIRSASDEPVRCSTCGGTKIEKIPSVFGMASKGTERTEGSSSGCGGCRRSSCAGCKR